MGYGLRLRAQVGKKLIVITAGGYSDTKIYFTISVYFTIRLSHNQLSNAVNAALIKLCTIEN